MSAPISAALVQLADVAGLLVAWRDAYGRDRRVEADSLRSALRSLDIACDSDAQCKESVQALQREATDTAGPRLLIVKMGLPLIVQRSGSPHYRLDLEDGTCIMGTAQDLGGGRVAIPGIRRPGYHRLSMGRYGTLVAVVPQRCPSPAELTGSERAWMLGARVYSLRRRHGEAGSSGGPGQSSSTVLPGWEAGGDYTAVGVLARQAAARGAAGLAISPVHAMFTADPARHSPYAPSSRLFLNAMYGDPAAVFDPAFLAAVGEGAKAMLRPDGCMDWPAIHAQRLRVLRKLYEHFTALQPDGLLRDFEGFREQGGDALDAHACYEALHADHVIEMGAAHGWQDWPVEYHDPNGSAVRRYARFHEEEVQFHVFLQWLAARSLASAHAGAGAAGMPLGLVADLAVGTDPRGSHAWSRQKQIMSGVSVGAPPDVFQPRGQDWGLTAFSPRALRSHGYEGFIETLRAVLAHAGGLRVDHILGLARMWLVPAGAEATDGVYLRFPREELMDLLTLEAWRHHAIVVGENLGTVPEDFNDMLEQRGVLGMSVLWFEQESDEHTEFRAPQRWPERSMAMVSTHDLPTLKGWWQGRDIHWRERQGQFDEGLAAEQRMSRQAEKAALWEALQAAGFAAAGAALPEDAPAAEILAYVASTASVLLNASLEDLTGEVEQPNLPGSPIGGSPEDVHPNWCRTLQTPVNELLSRDDVTRLLQVICKARLAARPDGENG